MGDYLKLTSDAKEWEPNSLKFEELESQLVNRYGELKEGKTSKVQQLFLTVTNRDLYEPFEDLCHIDKASWNMELSEPC